MNYNIGIQLHLLFGSISAKPWASLRGIKNNIWIKSINKIRICLIVNQTFALIYAQEWCRSSIMIIQLMDVMSKRGKQLTHKRHNIILIRSCFFVWVDRPNKQMETHHDIVMYTTVRKFILSRCSYCY